MNYPFIMKYSKAGNIANKVIIGLLLLLLGQGCKRNELPEDVADDAVFEVQGTVNGEPLKITAGENNYYMHSSYATDAKNILHFKGALKPAGCVDCRKVFEIDISNYTEGSSFDIDQALAPAIYKLVGQDTVDVGYQVQFLNKSVKPAGSAFQWNIDNNTLTTVAPDYIFDKKGIYNVQLISSNGACVSEISTKVYVGVDEPFCRTRIEVTRVTPDSIIFVARTNGRTGNTFDYFWDFGDGNTVNGTRLLQLHKRYLSDEKFKVQLITRDTLQTCLDTTVINLNTSASPLCEANFDNEKAREVHTETLSKIIVTYTDSAGTVYSSAGNLQSPGSVFRINSMRDYLDNERGEKTKLIECDFTGDLFNSIFGTIRVENMKATIAVAYP